MRKLATVGALMAASAASTSEARACWDGWAAASERVSISAPGDPEWSPARARDAATWLLRTQELVPPDVRVEAFAGLVTVCRENATTGACDSLGEAKTENGQLPAMFRAVARILRLRESDVSRARSLRAAPLTVQVFAAFDRASATAVAQKLNADDIGEHGFLNAGGFPAKNDVAHVLEERDAKGTRIFRVVVGAFLGAGDAASTLADVASRAHLRGFVRPL